GYAIGENPGAIGIADLNGDGHLDLIATDQSGLRVLLGRGDGTFTAATTFAGGGSALALGDRNGDGRIDAVTTDPDIFYNRVTVSVLLGQGDGTFAPAVDYNAGRGPQAVAIADLNRDGKADLAVGGPGVSVLRGNGDGTFRPF